MIKDFKKIDSSWQKKILKAIQGKLIQASYIGKKLVGDLSPFYRLRVGGYRIVYSIEDSLLIVTIIKVRHRKSVYR